jgi:hypothetical protein
MIIEDTSVITDSRKKEIKNLLYKIPFWWSDYSTTEKFPYYSHLLVDRPRDQKNFNHRSNFEIVSPYFEYFYFLVREFCDKYNVEFTNIIRACLNNTFYFPGYPYIDPHVDFCRQNHLVLLIYLNEASGETLIFEKTAKFEDENLIDDVSYFKNKFYRVKRKVKPTFGKIICFDGKHYHSNKFPKPGEKRVVCVFNLLT